MGTAGSGPGQVPEPALEGDGWVLVEAAELAGAGAPGKRTLRGIPFLQELRQRGFAIWPFDQPVPGQPVVAECEGIPSASARGEPAPHVPASLAPRYQSVTFVTSTVRALTWRVSYP